MRGKKDSDPDKIRRRWVIFITIFAFLLSVFMSTFSDILLRKSNTAVAFIVLIAIIFIGILFDIIGVAVTVTDEKPFHSMAASKVKGAKSSLMLIRNASRLPMSARRHRRYLRHYQRKFGGVYRHSGGFFRRRIYERGGFLRDSERYCGVTDHRRKSFRKRNRHQQFQGDYFDDRKDSLCFQQVIRTSFS